LNVGDIIKTGTKLINFMDVETALPKEGNVLRYSSFSSGGVWNISEGLILDTVWNKVLNPPNEYRPPYATDTKMGGARIFKIGKSMYIKNIPASPPNSPYNLEASGGDFTKITCTWNPPTEGETADIFYVYRDNNILQKGVIDGYFEDTFVEPDTEYTYYVTAVNLAGESGPSNKAIGHTFVKPSEPLNVSYIEENQTVTLNWSEPQVVSGTLFYKIYRDDVLIAETHSLTFTETLTSGVYRYYVTANNKYYESNPSSVITVTV
jgi:hypothetical protein